MNNLSIHRHGVISDSDIFAVFERWGSPELENQKFHTSMIRAALCHAQPSKSILLYTVRQKLKNMASRGLLVEVPLSRTSTAWMLYTGNDNGQN